MVTGSRDVHALRAELEKVTSRIAGHPLASRTVRGAYEAVEGHGSQNGAAIERDLAAKGLPSVGELGKVQASGTWSWWKLHRRKMKLENKIQRALPR